MRQRFCAVKGRETGCRAVRPNAALYLARSLPAYNDASARPAVLSMTSERKPADMKQCGCSKDRPDE